MRAFRAPQEEIDKVQARIDAWYAANESDDEFEVHADNWRSVHAFRALGTQWFRVGLNGARTGLRYGDVVAWLSLFHPKKKDQQQVFGDLQLMEHAVLAVDSTKNSKEG